MVTRGSTQAKGKRKTSTAKTAAKSPKNNAGKGGKREQNKEQTKEKILKSALELFSKKGFYKTTTKAIAQKAGIAEGTLFNYFKTKEDLALYFFEKEIQDCLNWYQQDEYTRNAPLTEKLFAITQRSLDRLAPYEEFIGAVYLRALQPGSKLHPLSLDAQELHIKELRFIRDILSEAEEKEEIPPVGDLGAYAVGFSYIGLLTYWLNDKSDNKESTTALLDRSLKIAEHILQRGKWEW